MPADPPEYYSDPRREMLRFVPAGCKKVLEVGCGTGAFALLLKEERNAEVWGIEICEEAAQKASARLHKVFRGDIEQDEFDLPSGYFDCIIFNDILEHLRDPWAVLRKVHLFLMMGGYIVSSIPNVRYFDNVKKLIKYKEWKYGDNGILDRTHLRFFTEKSVKELFEICGYAIEGITGIRGRQFPWKFRLINAILKRTFDDMRYERFACVGRKKSQDSAIKNFTSVSRISKNESSNVARMHTEERFNKSARLIAFYLPQYHPIPENDEWWGKGFTEWTNVAKAKPMFRGHYQPHIPADLGFYDLRVPEVRVAQAEMAKEYGIEAFCYYHYWFAGKRLLERPFNEVLESGEPDFPFCLCWANQTWTGIWHGAPDRILIEQTYPGLEDHKAHFFRLMGAFRDSRYLLVDGKPLFLIYRPHEIPEVNKLTDLWRELAIKTGLKGIYLVGCSWSPNWIPQKFGFDATTRYRFPDARPWISRRRPIMRFDSWFNERRGRPGIHNFKDVALSLIPDKIPDIETFPCLIPNWDNTPRSGSNGVVLHGSTPELFRTQIKKAFQLVGDMPAEHKIIFIKSWNEWAEGNHLEPDLRYGKAYLRIIKEEI